MDFATISLMALSFIAGGAAYHFKTEIQKWLAEKRDVPFFRVIMEYDHSSTQGVETMVNGVYPVETNINADFNEEFIQRLDSYYISRQDTDYNPMANNNEKVLIYVYDIVSHMAEPVLGEIDEDFPMGDDIDNIPALAYRGGTENKTVVDISNPSDPDNPLKKDLYTG